MAIDSGDRAWRFALALYGLEGVRAACLSLQDEGGVDVALALALLWSGVSAGALEPDGLERAIALSARWRDEVVAPLRAVRRRLGAGVEGVDRELVEAARSRVKAAELAAEEAQIRALASPMLRGVAPAGLPAAVANARAYDARLDPDGAEVRARAWTVLLEALAATLGAEPPPPFLVR